MIIMRKVISGFAAILFLAGCGASTVTPSPTASTTAAKVFWVADTAAGFRLFRETAPVARSEQPGLTALRYLVAHQPVDSDYSTLWPASTVINSVTVQGAQATVDIAPPKLNVGAEAEGLAIQQLLWTLLAAEPGVTSMRITVNGAVVESLAGHVDATKAFTRPASYDVVAILWLLKPAEGAVLSRGTVSLSGMACTFEANVVWTIRQGSKTVKTGSTTAAGACPTWSPWSVDVSGLASGSYTAEVADYSAKDGGLLMRDTKDFTVR